ncbi:alcohol acetyltransferase-like protein [Phanerochaete sordida]|uniref:Alcohol acetyltransferase-like protein n=1 Tax=Phanerochaete sordida TaxID=48140 RepID=A0A9P3G313_9APHY|nr:alcohol acetyltransferase-like protein [Phanerochaete sordida]
MSPATGDVVRDAGGLERYHIILGQLGLDSCVAICGEYSSTTGIALTKEALYPALHAMVRKHGALGLQVRPGPAINDVPQFVRLREIDLDTAVTFLEDDSFSADEALRAELERPFVLGTAAPLWRVTVANGRVVVLAFHHCIGDGQSAPALQAALWSALNGVTIGGHFSSVIAVPEDLSITGPLEALTNTSLFPLGIIHLLFHLLTPKRFSARARAWTGNSVSPTPTLDITVRCWEISPAQMTQILQLCRDNKTTFTAFLHTLTVGVLSQLLVARGLPPKYKTIATAVPVSLRRFTGVSPFALCDHVGMEQFLAPIAPLSRDTLFPWDAARKFGERLHRDVPQTRETLGMLRLLMRVGDPQAFYEGMLGRPRHSGVILSSLGRFPVREGEKAGGGAWRLEKVCFAQSDVVLGAAMKVNVVGSPEGSTNVAFAWGAHAIDGGLAEEFVKEMKVTLERILQ